MQKNFTSNTILYSEYMACIDTNENIHKNLANNINVNYSMFTLHHNDVTHHPCLWTGS